MAKTVVGLFDRIDQAQSAVAALQQQGFRREDIGLAANQEANRESLGTSTTTAHDDRATTGEAALTGAGVGAAVGGGAGLLLGLFGASMLAVPGIGPIIAAGPLAAALAGAGVGAVTGGLIGGLTRLGVPEEHAHHYAEGVRRGGTLVTVKTEDETADRAAAILNSHGAVDVERRAAMWRQQGWSRFDDRAAPMASQQLREERERIERIPVVQEQVVVGKREVEKGGVRVYAHIVEQPVNRDVSLREENVSVERHRVDRPVTAADQAALKDSTIEVRARAEEAVVGKQARVVEEVVVRKDVGQRTEHIRETEKHTDVKVEQVRPNTDVARTGAKGSARQVADTVSFEDDWRRNFQSTYGRQGLTYEAIAPAYRYGYEASSDPRFHGRDWTTIEPELRKGWESRGQGSAWERMKEAVKYAFSSSHRASPAASDTTQERHSVV